MTNPHIPTTRHWRPVLVAAALACSIAWPLSAQAATAASAAPPSHALAVPRLPIRTRTLPNGLLLVQIRDASAATASVQVWYRVGSKDDPQGRSGFAHLF